MILKINNAGNAIEHNSKLTYTDNGTNDCKVNVINTNSYAKIGLEGTTCDDAVVDLKSNVTRNLHHL